MEKFPVLIVGPNWRDQMTPFQGNNITKIPKAQLYFVDEEPELRHTYAEDTVERVVLKDGTLVSPLDPQWFPENTSRNKPKIPKKLKRRMVPIHELYATFEEYMEKYHARTERDPETGKFGYWWNVKGKWDFINQDAWKEILLLKDRTFTWQAKNGDIDWETMRRLWLEEAEARWEKYVHEKNVPRVGNPDDKFLRSVFGIRPDDDCDSFMKRHGYFSVYAVLYAGEWYQKGVNGWWSNIALAKDWEPNLNALLASIPPDSEMTVVGVIPSEENRPGDKMGESP